MDCGPVDVWAGQGTERSPTFIPNLPQGCDTEADHLGTGWGSSTGSRRSSTRRPPAIPWSRPQAGTSDLTVLDELREVVDLVVHLALLDHLLLDLVPVSYTHLTLPTIYSV